MKQLTDYAVTHYCRNGFNDRPAYIHGLHIYYKGEYSSYYGKGTPEGEQGAIEQYRARVSRLVSNGVTIIHWNQKSDEFGPMHIETYYRDLTGKPLRGGLDYGIDAICLANELWAAYGDDYAPHPRLEGLALLNGWKGHKESDEPCPLFSTKRTSLIVEILYAYLNGSLKIKTAEYSAFEAELDFLINAKESCKERGASDALESYFNKRINRIQDNL